MVETEETVLPEDLEVPQAALEQIDTSVPAEYLTEIMASELVNHLKTYHALLVARRSARQIGDHKRAEELGRQVAGSRTAVALIQHEHPKARNIADQIMHAEALKVNRDRSSALED